MSANVAIVTPAQLTQFAGFLEDSIERMRGESRRMRDAAKAAGAVWKDAKYAAFHKQLDECISDLEKFNSSGLKYAAFLQEKAALANKYLKRH